MNAPPTISFRKLPVRPLGAPFTISDAYTFVGRLDGGFVAAWTNESDDISAQLFDAGGARVGAEIMVNSQTAGTQSIGPIATLSGGGFVLTWFDPEGDTGAGAYGHGAVKAQVFSAAGDKIGTEILVNTAVDGLQALAGVAALTNGNFLVFWDDGTWSEFGAPGSQGVGGAGGDTSGTALKAQLFAADGSRIGGEILVNTTTQNDQISGPIAALANGGFAASWYDRNHGGTVQMFDAAGAKVGPELVVNEGAVIKSLTLLGNGNLLVLSTPYRHSASDPLGDPFPDLVGQILTPAGATVGGEFVVDSGPGGQEFPFVQLLPGGRFVVAWTDGTSDSYSSPCAVKAQLFAEDGSKIGGEVLISVPAYRCAISGLVALANGEIAIMYGRTDFPQAGGSPLDGTLIQLLDFDLHKIGDAVFIAPGLYGSLAFATPDGRMLMTIGQHATGQLLARDNHLIAAETVPFDLKGDIVIGDADAGAGVLTVTLSVPSGILDVTAGGSGASVAGSGTGSVTITGTLAQINALLTSDSASRVTFTSDHDSPPAVALTVAVNDNGNSGGGAEIATASLVFDIGPAPNTTYVGTAGPDHMVGAGGDDIFIGLAGNDTMAGGGGSDTYYVEDAGDVVVEPVSYGTDRVAASVSYALPGDADVEILEAVTLSATGAMDLIGNQFSQVIIGNDGVNILKGNGGDDELIARAGNDYLVGGPGNDVMWGGAGNDTYYVDSAGDVVNEVAGQGLDRVAASASYALLAGAEIELLEAVTPGAADAMNLTGNALANTINGNNGVNILRGEGGDDSLAGYGGDDYLVGGAGNDAMAGGLGNDTYYVDAPGDGIAEAAGEGSDRISSALSFTLAAGVEVETLEAVNLGGTEALALTGNEFANNVIGNAGANTIDGKGGFDLLIGAGGADLFAFTAPLGASNVDRIADFAPGADRIGLEDTVFLGLPLGAVSPNVFTVGAQAQDADDRLIYNQATGQLYFDFDGIGPGSAILFATLDGHPIITAGDFIVI